MRWIVPLCLVAVAVASAPRSVDAVPPECRLARDLPSSSAGRHTRRLLRGLIPSVYIRWHGAGTGTGKRTGRRPIGTSRPRDRARHERARRNFWEIGLRWRPLATLAAAREDPRAEERREMRIDPDLCRHLSRLRRQISSDSDPEVRTLLREAVLERHIEAIRNHE